MNRFSDAGSTPAVSSGSAAAELGYVYCKTNRHPTTVEFVRCMGCSSCSRRCLEQKGRAARLGLLEVEIYGNPTTVEFVYCKSNQHPTTVEFVRCVGCSVPEK